MYKNFITGALLFACSIPQGFSQQKVNAFEPVKFSQVEITDSFWKPKIKTVTNVTIPVCIQQTEIKTPRIKNFEKITNKLGEKHEGIYYDDSDVYKALEAIAYSLKNYPDNSLEKTADGWIDKIAAAQLPDGYLNTYYQLTDISKRWTDMEKHEDYCAGHLIEAGIAYFDATGKRKLLDVGIRFADHINTTLKGQNRHWVSGHQEIELALVKLYTNTKDKKYLALSDWFLSQRGHGYGEGVIWDEWKDPKYCQDSVPVKDQTEITGHAVRAMYLYTGAADVSVYKNDSGYMNAMKDVWQDVVYRNMYLTGGIGSSGKNEGFTFDFDLPNKDAYCETCASVGMVFWNQRMNLLTGETKYIDILERSLYNGALDGLSLSGDRFFYGNPLASDGSDERSEWFGTACCPSNISRLVESLGDYIYAKAADAVVINLFVGSKAKILLDKGLVEVEQTTNYPWDGEIKIKVSPDPKAAKVKLMVRIPGWATGEGVPGDAYKYLTDMAGKVSISLNGKKVNYTVTNTGYFVLDRTWKSTDVLSISLPMEIRRVIANEKILADKGKVAIERGPLVYCIEQHDNEGEIKNMVLGDNATMKEEFKNDLLGGISVIQFPATVYRANSDGSAIVSEEKLTTAIPYFSWANRGKNQMMVWLPRKIVSVAINEEQ